MRKNLLFKNLLMVSLLLLFTFASTGAALAAHADLPAPFCGELADEDCEILTESQAVMAEVEELSYTSQVDIMVAGIPDLPAEEISVSLAQDSVIYMDPTVIHDMTDFQSQMAEIAADDMEAFMSDYTDLVVDFYSTLGLDADLTITLPEEIAAVLSEQAGGLQVPEEINIQARMVEGFLYANLDELVAAIPELDGMGVEGWFGLDFATLVSDGLGQAMSMEEMGDPSGMAGFQAGLGAGSMLNTEAVRTLFADYVNVERLDDEAVDGQDVAVFRTTFDFGAFVASDGFLTLLRDNLELISQVSDTPITEAEFDEVSMGLRFLGPSLFQDLDFETVQSIGVEDGYVYRSEVNFNWPLKTIVAMAAMADGGQQQDMGDLEPVVTFNTVQENTDFDDAPEVEAPEDAQIIPLETLQQGMQ